MFTFLTNITETQYMVFLNKSSLKCRDTYFTRVELIGLFTIDLHKNQTAYFRTFSAIVCNNALIYNSKYTLAKILVVVITESFITAHSCSFRITIYNHFIVVLMLSKDKLMIAYYTRLKKQKIVLQKVVQKLTLEHRKIFLVVEGIELTKSDDHLIGVLLCESMCVCVQTLNII